MPGNTVYIDDIVEFKEYLKKNPNLMVKFTATWCKPCKIAKPIVEEYFELCKKYLDLVIVDADNGRSICNKLRVRGYPTLCSFVNGEMAEGCVGCKKEDILACFQGTMNQIKKSHR